MPASATARWWRKAMPPRPHAGYTCWQTNSARSRAGPTVRRLWDQPVPGSWTLPAEVDFVLHASRLSFTPGQPHLVGWRETKAFVKRAAAVGRVQDNAPNVASGECIEHRTHQGFSDAPAPPRGLHIDVQHDRFG